MEPGRADKLLQPGDPKQFAHFELISGAEGMTTGPGSDRALVALLKGLGLSSRSCPCPALRPWMSRAL